jgi:hypothetical protein
VTRRVSALGLLCGGALLAAPSPGAEPPIDADLLEFLGSVDSPEPGWHDYLEKTDVGKLVTPVAVKPGAPAVPPAEPASPPVPVGPGKAGHT